MAETTVIVGGGLAAVRTAQALRDLKYPGKVLILSDESHWPYDRPPLSKNFLLGKAGESDILLVTPDRAAELNVEIRLSQKVSLDRAQKIVHVAGSEDIPYTHLVIATGARPVGLPLLTGYTNVHPLRSLGDAQAVKAELKPGARIAFVGGGFIGLEIAAVAKELGCTVTVIEAAETPLAPVIGAELGRLVQRWHEKKGVSFRCGSAVKAVAASAGRVEALELASGERVDADAVIVGVGTQANIEWLEDSGLDLHRGLVCNELGQSSDPCIFGVGDVVCRHVNGKYHPTRQWTATTEQARRVARAICGEPEPGPVIDDHYFWSDQHGVRLQFVGEVPEKPRLFFSLGSPDEEKFVVLCGDEGGATAVFSLGCPRDFIRQSGPLRQGEKIPYPD